MQHLCLSACVRVISAAVDDSLFELSDVSFREARNHGLLHVGLPSRLAQFRSFVEDKSESQKQTSERTWWSSGAVGTEQTHGIGCYEAYYCW